jgi:hypothetical protein
MAAQGYYLGSTIEHYAQLIADSEARAVATLTAQRDELRAENTTLRAGQKACEACDEPTAFEVRQLRAEAERLKKQAVFDADHVHALNSAFATRAEVERSDAIYQRACEVEHELQAELVTEREKAERYRLATLKLDGELVAERARLDSGAILLTVAGERVWHCGVNLRTAIDAAMQEGAK